MRSFFHAIWQFNALLIAVTGVVALLVGSYALLSIAKSALRERHVTSVVPAAGSPAADRASRETSIGHFTRIGDTPFLWAAIERRDHHSRSYYAKNAVNRIDYVFYDTTSGRSHRLRNRDDGLIVETTTIAEKLADARLQPEALLVAIVEKDTNGDGLLTPSDKRALALSRPDGTGLRTLVTEIDRTLGWERLSANEAVVMVRAAGKTEALHVDTRAMTVLRRQPLLAPPSAPQG